jgi:hypothetical protein
MRQNTLWALAVVLAGMANAGLGQARDDQGAQRFLQQQRLLDDQLRQKRQEVAPLQAVFDFQWGGWLSYNYFNFGDGVQGSRVSHRPELAVWTRMVADGGAHELFARMRLNYYYFRPGDEYERQEDWVGPEFDQLWYQIDVGKALRLTQPTDPLQLKVRVGRQTVQFGTGYALDLPMDAVLLDAKLHDVRVLGLIGKSIRNFPNIERDAPVHSHMDRMFYGVQLAYEGWQRHVPFVYALWNDDRTEERPKYWFQDFSYDSFYLGFGSRGAIVHNLNYWAEGVYESGHDFGDGEFIHKDYIEAFGWDLGIEKLFDVPTRPRVSAEYMFASGDAGRMFSPTNAIGGNRGDHKDSGFNGFGFRDAGMALAPALSNLHVWRVGGALAPLERFEFFRDLELGTNWFLYYKNQARGAISDPLADEFNGYVGWAMDYFINWRLSSDLAWTLRWGEFFPGAAYTDQGWRHFLFTGVTWSF